MNYFLMFKPQIEYVGNSNKWKKIIIRTDRKTYKISTPTSMI